MLFLTELGWFGRLYRSILTLGMHASVFWFHPWAYIKVCWWWTIGKRVRARARFAALQGKAFAHGSSWLAYEVWLLQQYGSYRHAALDVSGVRIVGLIASGGDEFARALTLECLRKQGVDALVVGSPDVPTLEEVAARIDWSGEVWLLPLQDGDILVPGAIAQYQEAVAQTSSAIIYADDDLIDRRGHPSAPHFKPDWNSELFKHLDYLTGACIVRASAQDVAVLTSEDDWPTILVHRAVTSGPPVHLRRILHHRRYRPEPTVPATQVAHVRSDLPTISVIVPTRNRLELLRTCLDGLAATTYPHIEVIVVDNDSDDPETLAYLSEQDGKAYRVLRHHGAFNYSAINNRAVDTANGDLICLLNNDIEVIHDDWLETMAVQALRDDVGAVGAQLLYPDGRIQHSGVVIGIGNAAGHAHRFLRPADDGYFKRHALPQFVSAVTAACLVVKRERFLAVGGLNESRFAVAFNDVDLCLRLNKMGWQSFYEPRATLIHHESVSRGTDTDPIGAARFADELAALQDLWGTDAEFDPFHHPHLCRGSEQFTVRLWANSAPRSSITGTNCPESRSKDLRAS